MPIMRTRMRTDAGPSMAGGTPGSAGVVAGASDTAGIRPDSRVIIGGMLAVGAGLFAAWLLNRAVDPAPIKPAAGVSVFALLYALAQGIERLLEPIASWVGSTEPEVQARDQAVATALQAVGQDQTTALTSAANAQAALNGKRANRSVGLWAAATVLAMFASAATGMYLLAIVGAQEVPRVVELAVTGLAVGGGTKPLHDLIKSVEQKKEKRQDPPEVS